MTLIDGHNLVEAVEGKKFGRLVMTDETAVLAANSGEVSGRSSNSFIDKLQCDKHAVRLNSPGYVDRFFIASRKGAAGFLDDAMRSIGKESILESFREQRVISAIAFLERWWA